MRQALRRNPSRAAVSYTQSIPAPVEGWDAVSPISEIKPTRAYQLDNWIPRPGYVELRKGNTEWSGPFAAAVETLLVWRGPSSEKMFAASGTAIYDVTTETTVTASAAVSGLTNARWQYVNFSTAGGHFIILVNGADSPRRYNGSAWAVATVTATGLTSSTLIHVMAHQQRLFFLQKNSLDFYYAAPNAITGALGKFPLGSLFRKGGSLVTLGSWSVDGGAGQDDLAVFITSEGEAAIYQGNNPADANNWALVGVYEIGIPLGARSVIKWGADLAVITTNGVVTLSTILISGRVKAQRAALTARIQNAYAQAAQRSIDAFGWEAIAYAKGGLVIVNVPWQAGSSYRQYVMDTLGTGSWCRWLGVNALCWAVMGDNLYFGGLTRVCRADRGSSDAGAPITADLTGAWLYYGARGSLKQFKMIRPIFETNQSLVPAVDMVVDFKNMDPVAQPSQAQSNASQWGTAKWGTSQWGSSSRISADWTGVTGLGNAGAIRIRVVTLGGTARSAVNSTIRLNSFDVVYERGGVL